MMPSQYAKNVAIKYKNRISFNSTKEEIAEIVDSEMVILLDAIDKVCNEGNSKKLLHYIEMLRLNVKYFTPVGRLEIVKRFMRNAPAQRCQCLLMRQLLLLRAVIKILKETIAEITEKI